MNFPNLCAVLAALLLSACGASISMPDLRPADGFAGEQALGSANSPAPGQMRPRARGGPVRAVAVGPEPSQAEPQAVVAAVPDLNQPRRAGLFGLFGGGRADNAAPPAPSGAANAAAAPPDVARGTVLPFGEVATVCGLSARDLGKQVDRAPRDGRARWQLHDPDPSATTARTHFITGFRDRCARQFTGALVLFGRSDVHETTRYAQTNTRPYNQTDDAYEQVKSRICGVRPRVPCPADRLARLDRAVSFVTIYSRFGTTDEWYELLLVDGQLEAAAMSGF